MERPAKMGLSAKDIKKRAQKRRNRKRSASAQNNHRQKTLSNYHAGKQRKLLEAIDALAAAGATAEKGTGTAPLSQFESARGKVSL